MKPRIRIAKTILDDAMATFQMQKNALNLIKRNYEIQSDNFHLKILIFDHFFRAAITNLFHIFYIFVKYLFIAFEQSKYSMRGYCFRNFSNKCLSIQYANISCFVLNEFPLQNKESVAKK